LVVAIAGPPNAGKSTLLNRIARREAAIVSPYAGTTRDVIEVHLDLEGYPVTLLDTAGIRPTDDPVELEGVRRARARASAADLILWVVDTGAARPEADQPDLDSPAPVWVVENKADLLPKGAEGSTESQVNSSKTMINSSLTTVINKPETTPSYEPDFTKNEHRFDVSWPFRLSAETGSGVAPLLTALARRAAESDGAGEPALLTRERHRQTLETALAALRRALAEPAASREDLMAEELRLAATSLGKLTGRIDVEDVLDVIFRDFCIGK
jgi:tRNA modification GTPase